MTRERCWRACTGTYSHYRWNHKQNHCARSHIHVCWMLCDHYFFSFWLKHCSSLIFQLMLRTPAQGAIYARRKSVDLASGQTLFYGFRLILGGPHQRYKMRWSFCNKFRIHSFSSSFFCLLVTVALVSIRFYRFVGIWKSELISCRWTHVK